MEKKTLVIWYKNGNVLNFSNVHIFKEFDPYKITFTYLGRESGIWREATFIKDSIAGWAIEDDIQNRWESE